MLDVPESEKKTTTIEGYNIEGESIILMDTSNAVHHIMKDIVQTNIGNIGDLELPTKVELTFEKGKITNIVIA